MSNKTPIPVPFLWFLESEERKDEIFFSRVKYTPEQIVPNWRELTVDLHDFEQSRYLWLEDQGRTDEEAEAERQGGLRWHLARCGIKFDALLLERQTLVATSYKQHGIAFVFKNLFPDVKPEHSRLTSSRLANILCLFGLEGLQEVYVDIFQPWNKKEKCERIMELMNYGNQNENNARATAAYYFKTHKEIYGKSILSETGYHDLDGQTLPMGSSPDDLHKFTDRNEHLCVEYKTVYGQRELQEKKPAKNMVWYYIPQVQAHMQIDSSRTACVFLSWTPKSSRMFIHRRNEELWTQILEYCELFWATRHQMPTELLKPDREVNALKRLLKRLAKDPAHSQELPDSPMVSRFALPTTE
jgi:hypothetical protein